jgi:hypothetical protein
MWKVSDIYMTSGMAIYDSFTRFKRRKSALLTFLRSNLLSEIRVETTYVITRKCDGGEGHLYKK